MSSNTRADKFYEKRARRRLQEEGARRRAPWLAAGLGMAVAAAVGARALEDRSAEPSTKSLSELHKQNDASVVEQHDGGEEREEEKDMETRIGRKGRQ